MAPVEADACIKQAEICIDAFVINPFITSWRWRESGYMGYLWCPQHAVR